MLRLCLRVGEITYNTHCIRDYLTKYDAELSIVTKVLTPAHDVSRL